MKGQFQSVSLKYQNNLPSAGEHVGTNFHKVCFNLSTTFQINHTDFSNWQNFSLQRIIITYLVRELIELIRSTSSLT